MNTETVMRQTFASTAAGTRVRIRDSYRDHYRAKVWDGAVCAFVPAQDARAQLVDQNLLIVAGESCMMWRLTRPFDSRFAVLVAPEHTEEVAVGKILMP